jgi:hypothetical protein
MGLVCWQRLRLSTYRFEYYPSYGYEQYPAYGYGYSYRYRD